MSKKSIVKSDEQKFLAKVKVVSPEIKKVKTDKAQTNKPRYGEPGADWTPAGDDLPGVLIGKDADGWHGTIIRSAYVGFEVSKDRDMLLKGLRKLAKDLTAPLAGLLEDLEQATAQAEKYRKLYRKHKALAAGK